jgi:hypothetical protein
LCALYQKNNRGDIKSFFKEPFNFYTSSVSLLSAFHKNLSLIKSHCAYSMINSDIFPQK